VYTTQNRYTTHTHTHTLNTLRISPQSSAYRICAYSECTLQHSESTRLRLGNTPRSLESTQNTVKRDSRTQSTLRSANTYRNQDRNVGQTLSMYSERRRTTQNVLGMQANRSESTQLRELNRATIPTTYSAHYNTQNGLRMDSEYTSKLGISPASVQNLRNTDRLRTQRALSIGKTHRITL
jgi:hypothetical protein